MDKEDEVHLYNGMYSAIKRKEILPFTATWMDLEGIMLSEISQTDKDKYHMISLICGIKNTNEQTNKTEIDSEIQK